MIYVVRIVLAFHSEDPINDIRDKALDHFADAFTVNPELISEERGYIITEECYHDEDPPRPCVRLSEHHTPE